MAHANPPDAPPSGDATAQALHVTVSLEPFRAQLKALGDQVGAVEDQLCAISSAPPLSISVGCGHPVTSGISKAAKDLNANADAITVDVAVAQSNGTLTQAGNDLTNGKALSSAISTNLLSGLLDLKGLQDQVNGLLNQITSLVPGPASDAASSVVTYSPVGIFGGVTATFPGAGPFTSTLDGVKVSGLPSTGSSGIVVNVNPFSATATDQANAATAGAKGPIVSAENTTSHIGLPILNSVLDVNGTVGQIKTAVDVLHETIKSITTQASGTVSQNLPAPVQQALGGTLGMVFGNVSSANDTAREALRQALKDLATQLDSLPVSLTQLSLPNFGDLAAITQTLASTKVKPVTGGIDAEAISTVGNLSVLPIGKSLADKINASAGTTSLDKTTPLLSIEGVTSRSHASTAPLIAEGNVGLRTIKVLGVTINLDGNLPNADPLPATPTPFSTSVALPSASPISVTVPPSVPPASLDSLAPGQEWIIPVAVPGLGTLSLDITRGLPQKNVDSGTNLAKVDTSTLSVRLLNGKLDCASSSCKTGVSLPTGSAAPQTANRSASTGTSGVTALGADNTVLASALIGQTHAQVNQFSNPADCTVNCGDNHCSPGQSPTCPVQQTVANLPSTGLFGPAALPAGLALVLVAIVLRVAPRLRTRLRRMP